MECASIEKARIDPAVQPSLLRKVDLNKPVPRRCDQDMDDFVESEAFERSGSRIYRFLSRERGLGRLELPPKLPLPSAGVKIVNTGA